VPTSTTNYSLSKPLVNDPIDEDLWGTELNADLDSIDTLLKAGITTAVQSSQTTGFTATSSISVKYLYPCNATSAAFAATLPTAAAAGNGSVVYFQKTDSTANAVTVTRASSDTIDGATTYALSAQYSIVGLVSDGVSVWKKIAGSNAVFTGDSGSGGVAGLVPAPAAGDAAAGKVLGAGGTWVGKGSGNATGATQMQSTAAYTAYSGSHTVPYSDALPTTTNTEAIFSATAAVTSLSASDFLIFEGNINFDTASSGTMVVFCIFRDAETNPIAVFPALDSSNTHVDWRSFSARIQAIDTSAHTYTLRTGSDQGGTIYINGDQGGTRKYGGGLISYFSVTPQAA
jgi:hypothetical protein